ncbi:DNA-processing protein DprA [Streptomyces sp. ST2-7A]|uniref:DNA-processing protein DprA n=1 Tax=Streptomyces sp. ST2-7A TaxID=2907214 RepID=UPI001F2B926E|nr:DNA-processing protein DprA [Streptomyces sp. ST2-7A]MCE7079959.1 DNA-processing protein DprA [Streptomyces sp. ST2-7A]
MARARLCRVIEPGDTVLGRRLSEVGAMGVCADLREDRPPPGVGAERWAGLRLRYRDALPERDLWAAERMGARFVCPGDTEWPAQLNDLGDGRPVGLWVRGGPSLRLLAVRSVAVVGARACTDYGAHVAADLGAGLAEHGWTVVSGGALGIDGAAHRGALAVGGATVAVLACGVDVPYPASHADLLRRITEQGLVVAELPPGLRPTRGRFLTRNRVLAALTRGTVVIEAAVRSGALSTARRAADVGRAVMGVPGSVYSTHSRGVHRLLREEAVLVGGVEEILELVGPIGGTAGGTEGVPSDDVVHGTTAGPVVPRRVLTPGAERVLEALPGPPGVEPHRVAVGACAGERETLARLLELGALGFAEQVRGRWFRSTFRNGTGSGDGKPERPGGEPPDGR